MRSTGLIGLVICLLIVGFASGCGGGKRGKIDYESARTLPPLEVPPDLSSLPSTTQSSGAAAPSGSATYSKFEAERQQRGKGPQVGGLLPELDNVRLERAGGQQWLVAEAEPEQLWPQLHVFLDGIGLKIATEHPETGILETEWAENRASVTSAVQTFFAKITGQGYGTGLRDKYRIRLERGDRPATTEIYLSHRGMEQIVQDVGPIPREAAMTYVWQPRPSDPELEAEMLRLLMVHIGMPAARAAAVLAAEPPPERATLGRNDAGYPALNLSDRRERAWRRVGLSLDRIGLTVEDRDRSNWTYYIRYPDPENSKKKKQKKKKKKKKVLEKEYRVALRPAENGTAVEVLDENGAPGSSKASEQILSLLYEQLK